MRHVPGRAAAGQTLDQQSAGGLLVVAHVVVAAAAEGEVVEVDGLDPLGLRLDFDLGADARVDRVHQQDPGTLRDVGLGVVQLRGVAAAGVLHHELRALQAGRFEALDERTAEDGGRVRVRQDDAHGAMPGGRESVELIHDAHRGGEAAGCDVPGRSTTRRRERHRGERRPERTRPRRAAGHRRREPDVTTLRRVARSHAAAPASPASSPNEPGTTVRTSR